MYCTIVGWFNHFFSDTSMQQNSTFYYYLFKIAFYSFLQVIGTVDCSTGAEVTEEVIGVASLSSGEYGKISIEYIDSQSAVENYKSGCTNGKEYPSLTPDEGFFDEIWSHTQNIGNTPFTRIQEPDGPVFIENKETVLCTKGIGDCIGIAVWKPGLSCLYHCTKMELRDDTRWKFKSFIDELKRKVGEDLSSVRISIVSSCWSDDVRTVILLLEESGFQISSISIPDIVFASSSERATRKKVFLNKNSIEEGVLQKLVSDLRYCPSTDMALNTRTGQVTFKPFYVH